MAVFSCCFTEGEDHVEVYHAPIKTMARMMEKVARGHAVSFARIKIVLFAIDVCNYARES
jgi:hypothetical protein